MTSPCDATVDVEAVVAAAKELRDELTEIGRGPLIYPMVFDVIATTSIVAMAFADKITAVRDRLLAQGRE